MSQADIQEILSYWFGELQEGFAPENKRARWFAFDPEFDRDVASRFSHLVEAAANAGLDHWLSNPAGCLAFILLTDQFTRQIYRGQPEAFALDSLALSAARGGILRSFDRSLAWDERSFFYMPFEHSEDLLDQHTSVGLFSQLRDETPSGRKHLTGQSLRYAQSHRDIIQRFGRFPHRNPVLDRTSTRVEREYLAEGTQFGQ